MKVDGWVEVERLWKNLLLVFGQSLKDPAPSII